MRCNARLKTMIAGWANCAPQAKPIAPDLLDREEDWRAALADLTLARDITLGNRWYPAVVLEVSPDRARLGIRSSAKRPECPACRGAPPDINWARGSAVGQSEYWRCCLCAALSRRTKMAVSSVGPCARSPKFRRVHGHGRE